jgi:uncharacterized membrane protein YhhN
MKMKSILFTLLAVGSAILHIRAEYYGPQYHVYLFKPLTMVCIILIALLKMRDNLSLYAYAVIAGLLCSIAGDVFLMLPSDQFIAGLASFLVAHLLYIVAFSYRRRFRPLSWSMVPFALYGIVIFAILSPHLGEMKVPVLAYVVVILVMGWRAYEGWAQTGQGAALVAFFGALLFIVSDSVLGINRFRGHFEIARALNLSTYFTAQWLIALSIRARGKR